MELPIYRSGDFVLILYKRYDHFQTISYPVSWALASLPIVGVSIFYMLKDRSHISIHGPHLRPTEVNRKIPINFSGLWSRPYIYFWTANEPFIHDVDVLCASELFIAASLAVIISRTQLMFYQILFVCYIVNEKWNSPLINAEICTLDENFKLLIHLTG